jgi:RNA polymerase sigma-70 factor (ECF subfamily)
LAGAAEVSRRSANLDVALPHLHKHGARLPNQGEENVRKFVPLEETLPAAFSFDGDEKDEQSNRLYRAVRELKPIDRAIISLYLDEKSYDETAQILGITKTNVATRLMRLKKQLIEKLSVYE